MRRIALTLAAVGALALLGTGTAQAGHRDHGRLHDDLEHRDVHRYQYHRNANRNPTTYRKHHRLHDN